MLFRSGMKKSHTTQYYRGLLTKDRPEHVTIPDTMSRYKAESWRGRRRQLAYSTVGTPDYIAPEVFSSEGYGKLANQNTPSIDQSEHN